MRKRCASLLKRSCNTATTPQTFSRVQSNTEKNFVIKKVASTFTAVCSRITRREATCLETKSYEFHYRQDQFQWFLTALETL